MADKWGERPLALVIRSAHTGEELTYKQIKAHLSSLADAGAISKYAIPDKILFVEALPKTTVGKYKKKELRDNRDLRHTLALQYKIFDLQR